jgi:hypothetical protein
MILVLIVVFLSLVFIVGLFPVVDCLGYFFACCNGSAVPLPSTAASFG